MRRSMRSCLVVLSTCAPVAPKTALLLEMLEPEAFLVAERQVHVLHSGPGSALEQVVDRREEQQLPRPPVYRGREPAPVRVRDVRDVRVLLPRLDERPTPEVLRVPAEDLLRLGHILKVDHYRLQLPARYGDKVRYESDPWHLPHLPQKRFDLRGVTVRWRPVGVGALVYADEV